MIPTINRNYEKVALVTGCSSGIGHALVESLSKYPNIKVYASARNVSSISKLKSENVDIVQLDVCDNNSIKEAIDTILQKEEKIDILINNAGINIYGPVIDLTDEDNRRMMDTNFFGVVNVVREVAKHMIPRKSGLIANIGSPGGWISNPYVGMYCASKAAIHFWTDALRMELAPFDIKVSLVVPGAIQSDIAMKAQPSLQELLKRTLYQPIKDYIIMRAGTSQQHDMTALQFSDYAIAQLLKPSVPITFSYGPLTTLFKIYSILPKFITDYMFSKRLGLLKLRELLSSGNTNAHLFKKEQ
ncbi:oxidoreductase [Heterostelium album PN500]|uniref:Oxidoreductase n=1 Tax=Heterostelium pallidum (strain ATCC 26659 / Pp 5 / PN500) TaxID=670386 RepID=D3BQP6_HETP5|nr:oxidoreductase [Heterostelium album PN500]EFA76466.1 oxidoreductase [Heterostelium album PN500]|eukprot:XP_020428598.1 oxidoreductase [Heterostelium album PN500]